ncbi:Acetyltransferase (GNAT) family protein [Paenibacillus sp. GP183]|nr:Acetyltransferase (GNAT) family protein [Paenibacillus sp. GP183]
MFLLETVKQIDLIERLSVQIWPAEHIEPLCNWILRASGGITRRANSVFTWGNFPEDSEWLNQVESFYHNRGLPVYYHVSEASPDGLDAKLEQLGYLKDAPTIVMTAECKEVLALSKLKWEQKANAALTSEWLTPVDDKRLDPAAKEIWVKHFMSLEKFSDERADFYRGLMDRISPIKGFMQLRLNGVTAAVGTAVVEQGWAGLTNVVVGEQFRGQGISYRLIQELAEWSNQQGASNLYLQVMADNNSAIRSYTNLGFSPQYGYHYRCKV